MKETNVPKWSNPDYVNDTSEEKKAEMKQQQAEMLAKLDEPREK